VQDLGVQMANHLGVSERSDSRRNNCKREKLLQTKQAGASYEWGQVHHKVTLCLEGNKTGERLDKTRYGIICFLVNAGELS